MPKTGDIENDYKLHITDTDSYLTDKAGDKAQEIQDSINSFEKELTKNIEELNDELNKKFIKTEDEMCVINNINLFTPLVNQLIQQNNDLMEWIKLLSSNFDKETKNHKADEATTTKNKVNEEYRRIINSEFKPQYTFYNKHLRYHIETDENNETVPKHEGEAKLNTEPHSQKPTLTFGEGNSKQTNEQQNLKKLFEDVVLKFWNDYVNDAFTLYDTYGSIGGQAIQKKLESVDDTKAKDSSNKKGNSNSAYPDYDRKGYTFLDYYLEDEKVGKMPLYADEDKYIWTFNKETGQPEKVDSGVFSGKMGSQLTLDTLENNYKNKDTDRRYYTKTGVDSGGHSFKGASLKKLEESVGQDDNYKKVGKSNKFPAYVGTKDNVLYQSSFPGDYQKMGYFDQNQDGLDVYKDLKVTKNEDGTYSLPYEINDMPQVRIKTDNGSYFNIDSNNITFGGE